MLDFWQKVIGYDGIQRIMPVNYVQAFHDWLENTVKKLQNDEPQDRSTQFKVYRTGKWELVDFYPLQPRGLRVLILRFTVATARRQFRSLCQSKTA